MRAALVGLTATVLLGGCDISIGDDPAKSRDDVKVQVAKAADGNSDRLSVKLPFLDASMSVANLDLGDTIELDDGMKLAPRTKVSGLDVNAGNDKGRDLVTITFANPSTPAVVATHYRTELARAGYSVADSGGTLTGTKGDKSFTVETAVAGSGTRGQLRISKD
jgi:hypothetical protein